VITEVLQQIAVFTNSLEMFPLGRFSRLHSHLTNNPLFNLQKHIFFQEFVTYAIKISDNLTKRKRNKSLLSAKYNNFVGNIIYILVLKDALIS
jgi:hypothetical protein